MDKRLELRLRGQRNKIVKGRLAGWLVVAFSGLVLAMTGVVAAFLSFQSTSFGAVVQTHRLRFTVHRAMSDKPELDGGLFAPSGLLNVSVNGCGAVKLLAGKGSAPPCENAHARFDGVSMNTLVYGEDSTITLDVESGVAKLVLQEKAGPHSILAVFDGTSPEGARQWSIEPAHSLLTLILREAEPGGLRDETTLALTDGSALYVGTQDETSLVGTNNKLILPRLSKEIALRDSRMEISNLKRARVRRIGWVRTGKDVTAIDATLTGRSDKICLFGPYSEECSNEALNVFDYYSSGRWGHFLALLIGSGGLMAFGTLAVSSIGVLLSVAPSAKALLEMEDRLKTKVNDSTSERKL